MSVLALSTGGMGLGVRADAGDPVLHKSRWGPNDQVGPLNNITTANVMEAAELVKRGKSIRMGIKTNSKTPAFPPRTFSITQITPGPSSCARSATPTNYTTTSSSVVGIGPQLDGLGGIGIDSVYYNCLRRRTGERAALKKLASRTYRRSPPRGVALDMVGLTRQGSGARRRRLSTRKEIDAAPAAPGNMKINKGDVVIFYAGWTQLIGKDENATARWSRAWASRAPSYLASLNVGMAGADTLGMKMYAFEKTRKRSSTCTGSCCDGRHLILENVNADEAVKDEVYEGLFTLGPSRVTGAVQAIINPSSCTDQRRALETGPSGPVLSVADGACTPRARRRVNSLQFGDQLAHLADAEAAQRLRAYVAERRRLQRQRQHRILGALRDDDDVVRAGHPVHALDRHAGGLGGGPERFVAFRQLLDVARALLVKVARVMSAGVQSPRAA